MPINSDMNGFPEVGMPVLENVFGSAKVGQLVATDINSIVAGNADSLGSIGAGGNNTFVYNANARNMFVVGKQNTLTYQPSTVNTNRGITILGNQNTVSNIPISSSPTDTTSSTVVGNSNIVSKIGVVIGASNTLSDYGFMIGNGNSGAGYSIGALNVSASGNYLFGEWCEATTANSASVAVGSHSKANNEFTTAIGSFAEATGYASAAVGFDVQATNEGAFAFGLANRATAQYSGIIGIGLSGYITNSTANSFLVHWDTHNLSISASGVKLSMGHDFKADGSVFLKNVAAAPATPTGGGVMYVEAGALKYKGSSGTITVLGVA